MASLPNIKTIKIIKEKLGGNPSIIDQWNTPNLNDLVVTFDYCNIN